MKGQAVKKAEQDRQLGEDPEHRYDDLDPEILLESPEFQNYLEVVCRAVFNQFGPSPTYGEWVDLRQETLLNFVPWLKKYERKATLKSILNRIATNLCIDEVRSQKTKTRAHVEVKLDEIDLESMRNPINEDTDRRILFQECRGQFTGLKQALFDEFFTEGRSLREIAKRHEIAPQTAVNLMGRILKELKQFVLGQ
jgi:RNA polymerase sigma factor (sigma-70 family)